MQPSPQITLARSAIVTGAAQGLGLAIARKFSAAGSRVLLVDVNPKVSSHIGTDDFPRGRCFAWVCDLKEAGAARAVFANAAETLGVVDTLINNAAWSFHRPFLETTVEEFDRVVAINQRAPFFLAQEMFRAVSNSPQPVPDPVVINIASVNALAGNPKLIAYAGTKGALAAMTRAMAVEMAPHGIRVVSISPGAVDTPYARQVMAEAGIDPQEQFAKFLIKRCTTCEEIAELAWFLCTPACASVTGANWIIDGGYLAQ